VEKYDIVAQQEIGRKSTNASNTSIHFVELELELEPDQLCRKI
jgi:hypothetical protein